RKAYHVVDDKREVLIRVPKGKNEGAICSTKRRGENHSNRLRESERRVEMSAAAAAVASLSFFQSKQSFGMGTRLVAVPSGPQSLVLAESKSRTRREETTACQFSIRNKEIAEKDQDGIHKPMSLKDTHQDFEVKKSVESHKSQPAEGNNSAVVRSKPLTASFGRLKVQRVKAIAVKTSQETNTINENNQKLVEKDTPPALVFDKSVTVSSHSKFEVMDKRNKMDGHRKGERVSRTSQSQQFRGMRGKSDKSESEEHGSEVPVRGGSQQFKGMRDKSYKSEIEEHSSEVPVRGGSSTHFRGWNFRSESSYLAERRNLTTNTDFYSRKSFRDMGCSEFMVECLRKQLFQRPSHIQAMAFGPVLSGKSCVIADQSGSGKTLAYLAPVIQRLREEEAQGFSISSSQSPRVIIFVPTAELASQVLSNCRSISKNGVPFRSMVVTGGFRQKTQLENLLQGVDVLIATPGRFMFLMKEGFLQLENLRCAVLDEVDILFNDEDFESALQSLIASSPVSTQYLFVTATLPVDIYNKLVEVFPDCKVIMGPGMHRISPRLEEVVVDCSGGDEIEKSPETAFLNKKSALLQIVEGSPVPKTIVFCNKIETCRRVENVLKRFDRKGNQVQVLPFHAAMAQESRLANIKEFTNYGPENVSQILLCTDRASRGMDFPSVDHVVLFDFPREPSEYVRRVGRTARGAGGKGKAFILVVGKQVSLARRIMERNQKGHPLHHVPSAYELSN
ncbi:hypothetical protein UlMin_037789, partial [Ulmus minor]